MALIDLLHQDVYWRDNSGVMRPLDYMTKTHRTNLRRWLRRHAHEIKLAHEFEMMRGGAPTAEYALLEYDRAFEELLREEDLEFLKSTPLYRRLVQLCWQDRQRDHEKAPL